MFHDADLSQKSVAKLHHLSQNLRGCGVAKPCPSSAGGQGVLRQPQKLPVTFATKQGEQQEEPRGRASR